MIRTEEAVRIAFDDLADTACSPDRLLGWLDGLGAESDSRSRSFPFAFHIGPGAVELG